MATFVSSSVQRGGSVQDFFRDLEPVKVFLCREVIFHKESLSFVFKVVRTNEVKTMNVETKTIAVKDYKKEFAAIENEIKRLGLFIVEKD